MAHIYNGILGFCEVRIDMRSYLLLNYTPTVKPSSSITFLGSLCAAYSILINSKKLSMNKSQKK